MKMSLMYLFVLTIAIACGVKKEQDGDSKATQNIKLAIKTLEAEVKQKSEKIKEVEADTSAATTEKVQYATKQELIQLRSELEQLMSQLDSKLDDHYIELDDNFNKYKAYIDEELTNYVKVSSLQLVVKNLNDNFALKSDMLQIQLEQAESIDSAKKLRVKFESHTALYQKNKDKYKKYVDAAIAAWNVKLTKMLADSNNEITTDIQKLIQDEVSRIKVTQESMIRTLETVTAKRIQFEADLDQLKETKSKPVVAVYEDITLESFRDEIDQMKDEVLTTRLELIAIESKLKDSKFDGSKDIVSDINKKLFAPCHEGLKDTEYCYTNGTLIYKLGGNFIDPTKFNRTKYDFVRYLTLSGITHKNIVDKTYQFLVPGKSNEAKFLACHDPEDLKALVPPHKLWPKAIVLSLIFEQMTKDLNKQNQLGFLLGSFEEFRYITSWWRSACYHKKLTGNTKSDHIHAAAFDVVLASHDSFEYYKNYAKSNIWENDVFDIRYPLESSHLGFSIGLGHGDGRGNGKMHLGIGSHQGEQGQLREWTY